MFEAWGVVLALLSFGAAINIFHGNLLGYISWVVCCWIWVWGGIFIF